MNKHFLVTGTWHDKETGEAKASVCEINEGVSKNGKPYAFAATDRREVLSGTYSVGEILIASVSMTTTKPSTTKA